VVKLLQHVIKLNEFGLAWKETEKGRFRDDYFSPVKIPVVEHVPWVHRNLPVPPGLLDDIIQVFRPHRVQKMIFNFLRRLR
jgi:hypothetical protein